VTRGGWPLFVGVGVGVGDPGNGELVIDIASIFADDEVRGDIAASAQEDAKPAGDVIDCESVHAVGLGCWQEISVSDGHEVEGMISEGPLAEGDVSLRGEGVVVGRHDIGIELGGLTEEIPDRELDCRVVVNQGLEDFGGRLREGS